MRRNRESEFSLRRFMLQARRSTRALTLCDAERGDAHLRIQSSHVHGTDDHRSVKTELTSKQSCSNANSLKQIINNLPAAIQPSDKLSQPSGSSASDNDAYLVECPLCLGEWSHTFFYPLNSCDHLACYECMLQYLTIEISESRINIACPQCLEAMHPSDIQLLLRDLPSMYDKYEDFMVRRVLASDPDTRWCPAPDCSYAVVASGCASCPLLRCERPTCGSLFCYHCKAEWHPDQTCDAARQSRQPHRGGSVSISQDSTHRDDIKPCPRCRVLIVKMDDGSCNHMMCAVCGAEFCWLCMKEISDLHYLSPSGCTFWGKKPWSRKKKLLWQLGTLIGAPIGIALVAGIAIPAMIIGIPVWVGRKLHSRYRSIGKHKRNSAILGGVIASIFVSPILAGLAVTIGVPILLFYVYGVVPVSLCRAGGCGVSTSAAGVKFEFDEEDNMSRNQDAASVDAVSRIGATSIGEVSLSMGGTTQPDNVQGSNTALAGSIAGHRLEIQADVSSETASAVTCLSEKSGQDAASTKALAGSILSYKQHADNSEDCTSERVRFDDTVSYIHSDSQHDRHEKTSLCSAKSMHSTESTFRDDEVCTNSSKRCEKQTLKPVSKAAMLRNMFFHPNVTEDVKH